MNEKKVLQLMSLAMKAGKITAGEEMTERDLKYHASHLVLIARDASQKTRERFQTKARNKNVPVFLLGTKEQLGKFIGKEQRAVISVKDIRFSEAMIKLLCVNDESGGYVECIK